MEAVVRIGLGVFLVAHGLVHLLWLIPNEDREWPFRLDRSWLVGAAARKPVGLTLMALAVAGFALLGLAVWGFPGLAATWPALAFGAAFASLASLALFFDRQLLWGVAIDVAILAVAWWQPAWADRLG